MPVQTEQPDSFSSAPGLGRPRLPRKQRHPAPPLPPPAWPPLLTRRCWALAKAVPASRRFPPEIVFQRRDPAKVQPPP